MDSKNLNCNTKGLASVHLLPPIAASCFIILANLVTLSNAFLVLFSSFVGHSQATSECDKYKCSEEAMETRLNLLQINRQLPQIPRINKVTDNNLMKSNRQIGHSN
uniref:Uncharacterized protein n=1 Tax=Romanomermis culicivorax TaxID=13658 RepID=A0A915I7K0_ROMCU